MVDYLFICNKGYAYIYILIISLRISGKRSLSKLNVFDFIVTVALGSIFASTLTSSSVSFAQGLASIITLLVLQFIISKIAANNKSFSELIKSSPTLLFYNGEFLEDAMEKERITPTEITQSVRESGQNSLDDVMAVVLETNGNLSVLAKGADIEGNDLFIDVVNEDLRLLDK